MTRDEVRGGDDRLVGQKEPERRSLPTGRKGLP